MAPLWLFFSGAASLTFWMCLQEGNFLKGVDKQTVKREGIFICLLMFSSQKYSFKQVNKMV